MSKGVHDTSYLESAIICVLLFFPIPIETFLGFCSKIGKIERDKEKCKVLLPFGRLEKPVDSSQFDQCEEYLVSVSQYYGGFRAWRIYERMQHPSVLYHSCSANCECKKEKIDLRFDISQCSQAPLRVWFGFLDRYFYGLSQCWRGGNIYAVITSTEGWEEGYWELRFYEDQIVPGSLFFALDYTQEPRRRVYLLLNSRIVDYRAPIIYAMDFNRRISRGILAKSSIKVGPGKSLFCTKSNQCDENVYLSCNDTDTQYIFSLSIRRMEQFPESNSTRLPIVYQAPTQLIFDPSMIGVNVFIVKYPEKMVAFVMKENSVDSNNWYILFSHKSNRKLPENCFTIDSKVDDPFQCHLPIPSGHSLKYISITNETLWIHTSSNASLYDQFFETCFLMNDCFGCYLLSNDSPFSCAWDSDRCISTSDESPKNASTCIQLEKMSINNSTRIPNSKILIIKVAGICLTNTLIETRLLMKDGKIILPDHTEINEVDFLLDPGDDEKIIQNLNQTFLVINSVKLSSPIELALSSVIEPVEGFDWKKVIMIVSLSVGGALLLTFIFFALYNCCKKTGDAEMEIPELPNPKIIGGYAE